MAGRAHIKQSAALRGKRDFAAAIEEIENNIDKFDDTSILPALLQAFYAAHESGDTAKAKELAQKIFALDPNIPSIASYI